MKKLFLVFVSYCSFSVFAQSANDVMQDDSYGRANYTVPGEQENKIEILVDDDYTFDFYPERMVQNELNFLVYTGDKILENLKTSAVQDMQFKEVYLVSISFDDGDKDITTVIGQTQTISGDYIKFVPITSTMSLINKVSELRIFSFAEENSVKELNAFRFGLMRTIKEASIIPSQKLYFD